jgi:hypothetical protein
MVVVTCQKKTNLQDWSKTNWYRFCRQPTAEVLDAEFDGDKAKLEWSPSLLGSKKKRGTYRVVTILEPIALR